MLITTDGKRPQARQRREAADRPRKSPGLAGARLGKSWQERAWRLRLMLVAPPAPGLGGRSLGAKAKASAARPRPQLDPRTTWTAPASNGGVWAQPVRCFA